jgi:hypothetical protein
MFARYKVDTAREVRQAHVEMLGWGIIETKEEGQKDGKRMKVRQSRR